MGFFYFSETCNIFTIIVIGDENTSMPYVYDLKIDFLRDWARMMSENLKQMGYNPEPGDDHFKICMNYYNLLRRLVRPIPRKVLVSKEFKCPGHLQDGLNLVIEKIKKGIDLKPHLSKGILRLEYNDDLLNDWGIHHLHLGTVENVKGFVDRTGPVLFVRFDRDVAYLIQIMGHGDWAKQELIKIIHDNWPESIERFRIPHVESMEPKISDEDRKKLRKAHLVTFVEIDEGVIYAPLGMGYQSSGISTEVVRACMQSNKKLKLFENTVRIKIVEIAKLLKRRSGYTGSKFNFLLGIEDDDVYAFEVNSQTFVKLGPLFDR